MDAIDKINAILSIKGMSGADLERKIGVSNSVYSQWNTKKAKPSNKSLTKVADALGVDVSEILPDNIKEPTAEVSSELNDEGIRLAESLNSVSNELVDVLIALRKDTTYRPEMVDKVVEVVCPLSGKVEKIAQPYLLHEGKRVPMPNKGCDQFHPCTECFLCQVRVMDSVR